MGGEDPARVAAACAAADVHPLLCAVAHRTGDLSLLREPFEPDQTQLLVPGRGLGEAAEAEARALALAALSGHLASGRPDHRLTSEERRRIFGFLVGAEAAAYWDGFLTEELALPGSDPREPSWHTADVDLDSDFRCAVIGAGASGLAAAHRLRQAGIAVTVFEKNDDVGGTWLENVYPGCRVDVPNQLYSFSFAQTNDWVSRFSAQPDLLAYLQSTAKDFGLGECIRFRTEVTEARFDKGAREWSLTVRAADGTEATEVVDAIVCAVGQLNRPSFPAVEGQERFAGPSFHSAAWDHTVELRTGGSPSSGAVPARRNSSRAWRARSRTSTSTSAPRPGFSRPTTTATPSRRRSTSCWRSCRATGAGIGCGSSGSCTRGCSERLGSIPSGTATPRP